jgi:Domain of unknown function (DUF1905)
LSRLAFSFTAELWRHDGSAGWHFLTLPQELADEIQETSPDQPRPFGTVRATVTIGSETWSTSLFADRKRASYLLPIKAAVRSRAGLLAGDQVECRFELAD